MLSRTTVDLVAATAVAGTGIGLTALVGHLLAEGRPPSRTPLDAGDAR